MLYESIVSDATDDAIIELLNSPEALWLCIFAAWFSIFILVSLIGSALKFEAANKFSDVETIKNFKIKLNANKPELHCYLYFNEKKVRTSNAAAKLITQMYCDAYYNNLEILPDKYVLMFKVHLKKLF